MRTLRHFPSLIVLTLAGSALLVACTPGQGGDGSASSSAASVAASSVASEPRTHNVSYIGVVEEAGVSIYMQGTHRLMLPDGRFVLLEASDRGLDLGTYLGKRVELKGTTRPTVEEGGTIMSVEQVTVLDTNSSEPVASSLASSKEFCGGIAGFPCPDGKECVDDPSDDCDPARGGADCGGMCVPASSSPTSSLAQSSSSQTRSVAAASSTPASVASSPPSTTTPEKEAVIVEMAKQNYGAGLWTQKYCTSHIGFCIPVHKNWFYTSFGAKVVSDWHVEFGMGAVENVGDGAITLDLRSGPGPATDGQVVTNGSLVTGYRNWNGKHFEVTGDARLREAVNYMVSHIEQFLPTE